MFYLSITYLLLAEYGFHSGVLTTLLPGTSAYLMEKKMNEWMNTTIFMIVKWQSIGISGENNCKREKEGKKHQVF